jgi:serine O-acetyltransferase
MFVLLSIHKNRTQMTKPFFEILFQRSQLASSEFPDTESVHDFTKHLFNVLFASASSRLTGVSEIEKEFKTLKSQLITLIYNVTRDPLKSQELMETYFDSIPGIYHELLKDARAIADQDPAAVSVDEVIAAYPGFYAITLTDLPINCISRIFPQSRG